MKKVNRSKTPSPGQMQKMAENLEAVMKRSSVIEVSCWKMAYIVEPHNTYQLYVADKIHETFPTWPELQDRYFSLMRRR